MFSVRVRLYSSVGFSSDSCRGDIYRLGLACVFQIANSNFLTKLAGANVVRADSLQAMDSCIWNCRSCDSIKLVGAFSTPRGDTMKKSCACFLCPRWYACHELLANTHGPEQTSPKEGFVSNLWGFRSHNSFSAPHNSFSY